MGLWTLLPPVSFESGGRATERMRRPRSDDAEGRAVIKIITIRGRRHASARAVSSVLDHGQIAKKKKKSLMRMTFFQ